MTSLYVNNRSYRRNHKYMSFKIKYNSMAFPCVTVGYKESRWNFCQQKTGNWMGSTRRTTLLLESQKRNAGKR